MFQTSGSSLQMLKSLMKTETLCKFKMVLKKLKLFIAIKEHRKTEKFLTL